MTNHVAQYRTIVADPPWAYSERAATGKADRRASAGDFYPTMTVAEIAAIPVSTLAAADSHLYLWVTNTKLFEGGEEVMAAWGFTYKTLLTWYKTGSIGLGRWFRGRTEHVMFGVRGHAPIEPSRREQNHISAPNRWDGHSAKPEAFYDLVERVSPGPYLELFARRQRLGWDTWGNEALEHVEMGA